IVQLLQTLARRLVRIALVGLDGAGDLGIDAGDIVLLLGDLGLERVFLAEDRAQHEEVGEEYQPGRDRGEHHDPLAQRERVDARTELQPLRLHGFSVTCSDCRLNSTYGAGAAVSLPSVPGWT